MHNIVRPRVCLPSNGALLVVEAGARSSQGSAPHHNMYVCIYVCIYIYIYISLYIYNTMCVSLSLSLHIYVYIHYNITCGQPGPTQPGPRQTIWGLNISTHIYIYIYIHTYIHICIYTYTYIDACIRLYFCFARATESCSELSFAQRYLYSFWDREGGPTLHPTSYRLAFLCLPWSQRLSFPSLR